jgi:puromycin-sensitive aminopeptidase
VERRNDHRLPREVRPERYEIVLTPDLEAGTFGGEETVALSVEEATSRIVLNALDLEIASATLARDVEGTDTLAGAVTLEPEAGRATIELPGPVEPGRWSLRLAFSGTLNDKLRGFYRSTFSDEGTERTIATTQFEPTDARRAFPCWDEPDRKAVFSVTMVVDEALEAVSNTSVVEEERLGGGLKRVRFADTIPMSTYLVAFVAGPLEATPPVDVDGVPLRVLHRPGNGHLCAYALEVAAAALRFFSRWFGIPYPGDKVDLLALPDFAAGAMENLGAITFREALLLVDPSSASRLELERIADVVSHELAHMWFGDLVTMRWWNGLWLNEAFATFMEMLCVDDLHPEWERWVSFGRSKGAAMITDGLSSTRPIEYPVARPEDAEGMFDVLTYEKGAGVLRMLERYLGAEPFRKGIRLYLDSNLYGNAETTDLWDAIESATGEPARATMDSWIFQGGYPLVTVSPREDDPRSLQLAQQPFRYLRATNGAEAAARGSETGDGWQVPVLLRWGSGGSVRDHRVLLGGSSATVRLDAAPEWVVANAGGSGFYRVRYAGGLLGRLTGDLGRLEPLERLNLVSDAWATALADLGTIEDFVALLRRLGDEPDPNVWSQVVASLGILDRVLPEDGRPRLEAFVRELLAPPLARVGWEPHPGERETTGTLRATLVEALGTLGADQAVRARADEMHAGELASKGSLDPDLAGAVVSIVARTGGAREFEAFVDRYRNPRNPQEEVRYLYGLAGFRRPELFARALEMALSEVRTQNAPFLLGLAIANRELGPVAWRFIEDHWDELTERFPDNTIPRMLDSASLLLEPTVAADVRQFCESHPVRSGQRTVEQMLERLQVNLAFAERSRDRLARALGGRPLG